MKPSQSQSLNASTDCQPFTMDSQPLFSQRQWPPLKCLHQANAAAGALSCKQPCRQCRCCAKHEIYRASSTERERFNCAILACASYPVPRLCRWICRSAHYRQPHSRQLQRCLHGCRRRAVLLTLQQAAQQRLLLRGERSSHVCWAMSCLVAMEEAAAEANGKQCYVLIMQVKFTF